MRLSIVFVLALVSVASSALAANTGSISVFLSSPDDNSVLDSDPAVGIVEYAGSPGTVPIEIRFSATTSGPDGPNNGVQGISLLVAGSALAGTVQGSLIPDPNFVLPASSGGLGFDINGSAGGSGAVGTILSIGDIQATIGNWTAANDAPNVGHVGTVLLATGDVALAAGLTPAADYTVTVGPDGNSWLWDLGFGDIQGADGSLAASLTIRIVGPVSVLSRMSWGHLKSVFKPR